MLDGNFVGAYLQGSFADGDFDEDSDVDFLIIVAHEIADDVLPALQARHAVVTREKAIVLTGPDPRDLIDEVSADALREEVCLLSRFAAHRFADPSNLQPRWVQAFFVVVYCRMLHTLAIGAVTSKQAATAWAAETPGPALASVDRARSQRAQIRCGRARSG